MRLPLSTNPTAQFAVFYMLGIGLVPARPAGNPESGAGEKLITIIHATLQPRYTKRRYQESPPLIDTRPNPPTCLRGESYAT